MPTRNQDIFVFCDDDDLEEPTRYGPGGLYPVKMGDILGPETSPRQYKVFAKLGWGTYSTVWLARDLIARNTVSMKFLEASDSPNSDEAQILNRLRAPSGSEPAPVLQIIASFTLRSANGVHQVIVTEPVLLLEHFLKLDGVYKSMKTLVRQALEGLAFIHGRGIVHGDIHPKNLGVALPELTTSSFSEVEFLQYHGVPYLMPLLLGDDPDARDPASFPPYLSSIVNLGPFLLKKVPGFATREPQLRILDLGCAYVAKDSLSSPYNTPAPYAAPEFIFSRVAGDDENITFDSRADIWALATTIHEMAGGGLAFEWRGMGRSLLQRMVSLCGGAPEEWVQYLARVSKDKPFQEYNTAVADALWAERAERFMKTGASKADAQGLVTLLRRMLVIDPSKRPSAFELLQDPYFAVTSVDETPTHHELLAHDSPSPLPRSVLVA
ncbi:kinase-like domain-containing protein [Mycena latifolia]|nr:kinase-like domain-containing protein [Mycena latifolia]